MDNNQFNEELSDMYPELLGDEMTAIADCYQYRQEARQLRSNAVRHFKSFIRWELFCGVWALLNYMLLMSMNSYRAQNIGSMLTAIGILGMILGLIFLCDWLDTRKKWKEAESRIPEIPGYYRDDLGFKAHALQKQILKQRSAIEAARSVRAEYRSIMHTRASIAEQLYEARRKEARVPKSSQAS